MLVPLAAVAAWVLFAPSRREVVVGSLRLWRQAKQALPAEARRRRRRVNLSWLLLLAGGLAGVLACAGWTVRAERPGRVVAIVVVPSAELIDVAVKELWRTGDALLNRFDANDRVYVAAPRRSLPDDVSAAVSPARAKELVAMIHPVPIPAATLRDELVLPADADHVYVIGPPPLPADGARVSHIPVVNAASAAAPRMLAVAATPLPDGNVQLFVRAAVSEPIAAKTTLYVYAPSDTQSYTRQTPWLPELVKHPWPTDRDHLLLDLPVRDAYFVALEAPPPPPPDGVLMARIMGTPVGTTLARAGLVRRETVRIKVATVGEMSMLVERLLRANIEWERMDDPADADVVIAVQAAVPEAGRGKPVLAIDPPSPPASWRRGFQRGPVLLGQADVAADPVTAGVDVARVSVRWARPFVPVDALQTQGVPLMREGGETLLLRSDDESSPRRVDVAFDIHHNNTDWVLDPGFVVLMCNAVDWLADRSASQGEVFYEFVTPERMGPLSNGTAAVMTGWPPASPLPWPGLYRDVVGQWHGVFIPNLAATEDRPPGEFDMNSLPLPAPRPLTESLQLWPWLLASAATLWLAGWWSRR